MHLNVFGGLSCAFILTLFDLTCYMSVYRITSVKAHANKRPSPNKRSPRCNIKQAPLSNKRPLSTPHNFLK